MSSTVSAGSINPWVTPITMGYLPREGTREANSQYNWTVQSSYTDDLTQLQSVAGMSTIQGVLIHNRGNTQSVTLTVAGTGQSITCPARSEATFPLIMGMTAPQITITVNGASTATTRCNWLNYPVSAAVWTAPVLDGPTIDLNFLDGSVTVPPMTFSRSTVANYFDNTGTLQQAAVNVPRIDWGPSPGATPLGLLIEEARSNFVHNPRGEGAGPPAIPTNWQINTQNTGLLPVIAAVGTEEGIPYVDFQFSGTTAGGTQNWIQPDNVATAATPSQAWTYSAYLRLVSGSLPGGTTIVQAGGDNIATQGSPNLTPLPSAAALSLQRYSWTWTTNAGAVTALSIRGLVFTFPSAPQTLNFTIRVGGPQYEPGGNVSSLILPPAGAPAASFRSGEIASMTTAALGFVVPSTVVVDGELVTGVAANNLPGLAVIDDGTGNNRITMRLTSVINSAAVLGGTATAQASALAGVTLGVPLKAGEVIQSGSLTISLNGAAPVTGAGVTPTPATLTTLRIGQNAAGSGFWDGYIRRFRYWPRAMGSGELQSTTT